MKLPIAAVGAVILAVGLAGCGGDSSTGTSTISSGSTSPVTTPPAVNNVQPIIVDAGPAALPASDADANVAFTTVVLCVPGTTTCQSIDHVIVDTGSWGLRIVSSVLTLNLPTSTATTGAPLGNCVQYADSSYQWGPVATADVKMAGEIASSVPIQIAGAANFPAAPSACSAGGTANNTVASLGANGLLGVGLYRQDCGPACASTVGNPSIYFSCGAFGCTTTNVSVAAQLQNPVWMFTQDNNGLAIVLPAVGTSGAATLSGSMIFGIGTQSNNSLGAAKAMEANSQGNLTTTFNGIAYPTSVIDSGSNGIYFLTPQLTGLPNCAGELSGWYCPTATTSFTAINSNPSPNGSGLVVSENIAFSIANALALFSSPNTALPNLGGANAGMFDWGLPFFFGRTVFIGIESQVSGAGVGPYWAY
jgi:hypothetical protein